MASRSANVRRTFVSPRLLVVQSQRWRFAGLTLGGLILVAWTMLTGMEGSAAANEGPARPAGVAALIGGREVSRDELWAALAEASGGQVVREFALGVRLDELARARGVVVGDAALREERVALAAAVGGAGLDADSAARVIEEFRRQRGLGPVRFEALLRRNAMLRAMTAGRVNVTESQVQAEYEFARAPVARALLYVAPSIGEAGVARRAIMERAVELSQGIQPATKGALVAAFADRALLDSIDPTGAAGGVLPAFSLADASIPVGIRGACARLGEGEVSNVIALASEAAPGGAASLVGTGGGGGGAIVLLLKREVPEVGTLDSLRPRLRAEIARRQQRAAMDALSRELLEKSGLIVMDASLAYGGLNKAPVVTEETRAPGGAAGGGDGAGGVGAGGR